MRRKLAEKEESKKEKDEDIADETKEVEINKFTETDNDELFADAANNALLIGGCHSSSHGVLRRRSIVCGIDDKFVIVRLFDLSVIVNLHLLGHIQEASKEGL